MTESVGEFEYKRKDLIGHGAFAVVFKGRRKKDHDATVAIKCITKKNLSKSQTLLEKEIKILKELQHENVVALYDCKETTTSVYLVMEYCNGGDLADYLQAKGTLSEDTIRLFLKQIAAAMKVLHSKGIIHRDLKPQNILLSHSGKKQSQPRDIRLKIADFGFARFLHGEMMAATLCGSPMYMAPEVIMSLNYDGKADLWSIGTIVFQCLTGKAPFQASSPQELKNFYQKAKTVTPNIPVGTSNQLQDLLMRLLKRNQKERMDFPDFFSHPFLSSGLQGKSSSPVPVPVRSATSYGSSGSSASPGARLSSISPIPGSVPMSSPEPSLPKVREVRAQDGAVVGSLPSAPPVFHNLPDRTDHSPSSNSSGNEPEEDFVMVPANLPSDPCSEGSAFHRKGSANVEFQTLFTDSPPRITSTPPKHSIDRNSSTQPIAVPSKSSTRASDERPSSLPVHATGGSPGAIPKMPHQQQGQSRPDNEPIPVPSALNPFANKTPNSSPMHTMTGRAQSSPKTPPGHFTTRRGTSPLASPQSELPGHSSPKSLAKPPSPTPGFRPAATSSPQRSATPPRGSTPPMFMPNNTPPRKAQFYGSPSRSPLFLPSPASLPTIIGSPTKKTVGFDTSGSGVSAGHDLNSPSQPLAMPFAARPKSLRMDPSPTEKQLRRKSLNIDNPAQPNGKMPLGKSASSGRLSDQFLLRAAFGHVGSPAPTFGSLEALAAIGGSQPASIPYATSPPSPLHTNILGAYGGCGRTSRSESLRGDGSPTSQSSVVFSTSPSSMEGPITFVAPELPEETLMEPEHNETLEKLTEMLYFVDGIMEVIKSKAAPLAESLYTKQKETFAFDQICFFSEGQRQAEQLVLYLRALQILANALQLARDEVRVKRLQPSNAVKTVTQSLNEKYHECLSKSRELKEQESLSKLTAAEMSAIKPEKLLYDYAIELCQTAALDELFGNPQECASRYRYALALLNGLILSINNEQDRELLYKYQIAVQRRLSHVEKLSLNYMVYVGD
ncbi:serine/threonine-protein kinase ULK2-like [Ptychodera flava]|uniref:serine/threonine-protein kinase ULK2-like n=1 Tax=Ptychodera flava TaxID=63121 RepID=UPI003969CA13